MEHDTSLSIGSFSVFKQEGVRQFYCRWTEKEDELLMTAVKKYGPHKWSLISQTIPGRTPAQCSTRWHGALNSTVHKGRWSADEDEILIECVRAELKMNNNDTSRLPWNAIAKSIPHRTGIQCQSRWTEALDPSVRKGRWDKYEDELLRKAVGQLGCCWIRVANCIPSRTQRQCRTRWNQIKNMRRPNKQRQQQQQQQKLVTAPPSPAPISPVLSQTTFSTSSSSFPTTPQDETDQLLLHHPNHSSLALTMPMNTNVSSSSSPLMDDTHQTHHHHHHRHHQAPFSPPDDFSTCSTSPSLLSLMTPTATPAMLTLSTHASITMPETTHHTSNLSPPTSIPALIIPTSTSPASSGTAMDLHQLLLPSHHNSITIPKDPYSFLLDHHPPPFLNTSSMSTILTTTPAAQQSTASCVLPNVRHLDASLSWLYD